MQIKHKITKKERRKVIWNSAPFYCILLWNQTRIQKKMGYFRHLLWSFMILEGPWVRKLSGYFPFITYDTWGILGWRNCQATSLWYLRDLGGGYFPLITYDAWGTWGWGNCQVTSLWSPMILEGPWSGETVSLCPFGHLWYWRDPWVGNLQVLEGSWGGESVRLLPCYHLYYLWDPEVGETIRLLPFVHLCYWREPGLRKLSGYFPLFICATGGNLGWGNCQVTSFCSSVLLEGTWGGGNCQVTSLCSSVLLEGTRGGENCQVTSLCSSVLLEGTGGWGKLSGYFPLFICSTGGNGGGELSGYFPLFICATGGNLGWGNCQVTSLCSSVLLEGTWVGETVRLLPFVHLCYWRELGVGGTVRLLPFVHLCYWREPGLGKLSGYFPWVHLCYWREPGLGKLSGYFPLFICATGGNWG